MKSNYPRAERISSQESKPRIWRYSIGLGLVAYGVVQIYTLAEGASSFLGRPFPSNLIDLLYIPAVAVGAAGVVLLWKCSRWKALDKVKMVSLTVGLMHLIVFAVFAYYRLPHMVQLSEYTAFLIGTLYFAASLAAACTAFWTLAALVRMLSSKVNLPLREASPEVAIHTSTRSMSAPIAT
ncbi:MAG TPA: hypothetical protein VK171_05620, partial [Fimbriimonas sp.]|nr:hypothetical protein [Fimbriimonas sp.]